MAGCSHLRRCLAYQWQWPQVQADIEALGLKDSRPRRFCLSIDGAGQCTVPCGAVLDDLRFTQLFAQGRINHAADWQPVLLQRINGQLQLQIPAALLAAASDGAPLDLQIGGACSGPGFGATLQIMCHCSSPMSHSWVACSSLPSLTTTSTHSTVVLLQSGQTAISPSQAYLCT